jgi:hypothetical protein
MPLIDIKKFQESAVKDPEFKREMRYYDGSIRLGIGDGESYVLTFRDGVMTAAAGAAGTNPAIFVEGSEAQWAAMLEPLPKPFFQSLQSSAVRHGVKLSTTDATFAYLPALNRMMQLLRIHHQDG